MPYAVSLIPAPPRPLAVSLQGGKIKTDVLCGLRTGEEMEGCRCRVSQIQCSVKVKIGKEKEKRESSPGLNLSFRIWRGDAEWKWPPSLPAIKMWTENLNYRYSSPQKCTVKVVGGKGMRSSRECFCTSSKNRQGENKWRRMEADAPSQERKGKK